MASCLAIRALLMRASGIRGNTHQEDPSLKPGWLPHVIGEAVMDGAFMALVVTLLFPVLLGERSFISLSALRQVFLPALVVGGTDAVAVALALTVIMLVPALRRLQSVVPAFKVFIEGVLLFEFCVLEFSKYVDVPFTPRRLVTAVLSPARAEPLHSLLSYPLGFFVIGYALECGLLMLIHRAHDLLERRGTLRLPSGATAVQRHLKGLVGGLISLLMYAALSEF